MRLAKWALVILGFAVVEHGGGQDKESQQPAANVNHPRSFTGDVFPLIEKHCLPCHAEENYNPSELSLDSYDLLMAGGKHGPAVKPGKPEESILVQKLGASPPFGNRMPPNPRKKGAPPRKRLTEAETRIIVDWIAEGARRN
jgi:Planctomycete cytochrome C